ncbi:uncharacterized protein N7459_001961 [Penicillium hispanicum]|uniref:uncharacterized protein n=1 Tax=Penicillium hispanicum TaxID=1080232 RepID=UPI002540F985|nr:uncharacterized protein N7459_001961 [Penicillium hispanicum]KAJ5591592.1 hypothetical protein N7459_001961 [Penicillium hispanicum]
MRLTFIVPIFLALLQSIACSPTSSTDKDLVNLGWDNEGTEETDEIDDPPEYSYMDAFGNILDSPPPEKRDVHGRLVERDNTVIFAKTKRDEVKFWSQSEGQGLQNLVEWAFLPPAGAGTRIYAHDSGLNIKHSEFLSKGLPKGVTRGKISILPVPGLTVSTEDTTYEGHGTCVADKAVGVLHGIAKGAEFTMVPGLGTEDDLNLAGLQALVEDIRSTKQKTAKGATDTPTFFVVNLSYHIKGLTEDPDTLEKYRQEYLAIVKEGALLVISAGNDGRTIKNTNKYPALFAQEDAFKNNTIVVGGINVLGRRAAFSQGGPLVKIWAPTLDKNDKGIKCASGTGDAFLRKHGTSFSAPQVAGLAAYFYSTDSTIRASSNPAKAVKEKIVTAYDSEADTGSAWARRSGSALLGIWNLQTTIDKPFANCVIQ